jgi:hypothetical protein
LHLLIVKVLEAIQPGGNCAFQLTFLPLRAGYVSLAGITVIDRNTNNSYQFTGLRKIFVEKEFKGGSQQDTTTEEISVEI